MLDEKKIIIIRRRKNKFNYVRLERCRRNIDYDNDERTNERLERPCIIILRYGSVINRFSFFSYYVFERKKNKTKTLGKKKYKKLTYYYYYYVRALRYKLCERARSYVYRRRGVDQELYVYETRVCAFHRSLFVR